MFSDLDPYYEEYPSLTREEVDAAFGVEVFVMLATGARCPECRQVSGPCWLPACYYERRIHNKPGRFVRAIPIKRNP